MIGALAFVVAFTVGALSFAIAYHIGWMHGADAAADRERIRALGDAREARKFWRPAGR